MKRVWPFVAAFAFLAQNVDAQAYDLHDNAILHARRGQLLLERGQAQEAAEEYKAAILLNPAAGMAASLYNNLGVAYRKSGQTALAIASFQYACRKQATYALYYQNLVDTWAEAGYAPQAKEELRAITQENPDNAEAWFILGLLHKEAGDRNAAKTCFSRFLKLQPESELARAARTAL